MDCVHRRSARLPEIATVLTLIMILAVFGSATTTARAQEGADASGLITLEVVDADLSQVVRILIAESRQSIVIGDPDIRQKKVTAMLNGIPLETALRYVVDSVGCTMYRQPDGVYIIGSKPQGQPVIEPENPSVPAQNDATVHGRAIEDARFTARRVTKVDTIKLYNSTPVDIMWILGLYKDEQAPVIQHSTVKPGVYMQQTDGSLQPVIAGDTLSVPANNLQRTSSTYAQRMPSIADEAGQAYPPSPPGAGRPTQTQTTTRPGQPTAPGASTSGTTSSLLPQGIDYIMPYELDNSLIVRGDEEGIEELKLIISKLDVAPKQIMIEARFVSIATSELDSLGINWTLERLNTTFQTQFAPAGNILVGYAAGDLMANLQASLSQSHGKLINAPIITTINNVPASIGFETTVPYLSSTMVFNQTGNPTTASQTYFLPIRSELFVLPRINNADNSITVTMMPTLSDIEKYVQTANGDIPIVNSQYVQTVRRVANGETIVLGGLIRKDDSTRVDKIPLLGDLPLVGPLFRSTKNQIDDKELLIFLTPTVIPEKPISGSGIGVMP